MTTHRRVRYDRNGREMPQQCAMTGCEEKPKALLAGKYRCPRHWRAEYYRLKKAAAAEKAATAAS